MEYQFIRDLTEKPEARFSMDHEAMGSWLTTEVGTNKTKVIHLLNVIDQLQAKESWEFEQEGIDFNLRLTRDTAKVKAALLESEMMSDDLEDVHYYDDESISHCGLLDFRILLISWLEFI